jgi:hypothetical protein
MFEEFGLRDIAQRPKRENFPLREISNERDGNISFAFNCERNEDLRAFFFVSKRFFKNEKFPPQYISYCFLSLFSAQFTQYFSTTSLLTVHCFVNN